MVATLCLAKLNRAEAFTLAITPTPTLTLKDIQGKKVVCRIIYNKYSEQIDKATFSFLLDYNWSLKPCPCAKFMIASQFYIPKDKILFSLCGLSQMHKYTQTPRHSAGEKAPCLTMQ